MSQAAPGQFVFGRDMIFDIQHKAKWELIKSNKQRTVNKNSKRENFF